MKILMMSLVLLAGCSTFDAVVPVEGPQKDPPLNKYQIEIIYYNSIKDIQKVCKTNEPGRIAIECTEVFVNPCRVHVLKQDWQSFIHGVQHCHFGLWHKNN